ncbi:unnamed protein product, partial [Urochloa humidicola]
LTPRGVAAAAAAPPPLPGSRGRESWARNSQGAGACVLLVESSVPAACPGSPPRPRAHGIRQQMSCRAWEPNCDVRNRRLDAAAAAARSRRREVLDEWVFVFGMKMNRCDLLSFIQRLGHGDNDEHYIDNEELVCDN